MNHPHAEHEITVPQLIVAAPLIDLLKTWSERLKALESIDGAEGLTRAHRGCFDQLKEAVVAAGTAQCDLDTREVARLQNQTTAAVTHQCRTGRLPGARRVGGEWRIPAAAVNGATTSAHRPRRRAPKHG